jgi:MFS family permease
MLNPASGDGATLEKSCQRSDLTGMNESRPRPPASLYVAGPFSMGYVDFFTFLIPLYGLSLGLGASEIGILVGARSIIALFLSIHIGLLMDRFGTRRVTLFFLLDGDGSGAAVPAGARILAGPARNETPFGLQVWGVSRLRRERSVNSEQGVATCPLLSSSSKI